MKNDKIISLAYEFGIFDIETCHPKKKVYKIQITPEIERIINDFLNNAIRTDMLIDDCAGTLGIVYDNGLKVFADRGLTDGKTYLGNLLDDYVDFSTD